jgi:hypothetical protein
MKRLFLSSYYQFTYQPDLIVDEDVRVVLDNVLQNGAIVISAENLQRVIQARLHHPYQSEQSDYLTQLYSDIEVAIQAKKIEALAEHFGYRFTETYNRRPKLIYLEIPVVNDILISDECLFTEDIFVLNSHGKPSQIDGGYQSCIDFTHPIGRIVVDACSSSASVRHKKSIIEQIAVDRVAFHSNQSVEIVGHNSDFNTDDTQRTAFAIFANRDLLPWTLTCIKTDEIEKEQEEQNNASFCQKKHRFFKKDQDSMANLRNCLIDIASKLTTSLLYHDTYRLPEYHDLVAKIATVSAMTTDEWRENFSKCTGKKEINSFKKDLKDGRKLYINRLTEDELLQTAFDFINLSSSFASLMKDSNELRLSLEELETFITFERSKKEESTILLFRNGS